MCLRGRGVCIGAMCVSLHTDYAGVGVLGKDVRGRREVGGGYVTYRERLQCLMCVKLYRYRGPAAC